MSDSDFYVRSTSGKFHPVRDITPKHDSYIKPYGPDDVQRDINYALTAKTDATYYNDPLKKVMDGYMRVNPIYEDDVLAQLGSLDMTSFAPNQSWLQYGVTIAKSNSVISDDLIFSHGDSKIVPAVRKSKWFQFGVRLREVDYMSYMSSGGAGKAEVAERVAAEIQASKGLMLLNLIKWLLGYQALTSEVGFDSQWIPLIAGKAATGTATDPEDICSTAGTATAYAINFTGSNKSVDFVSATHGTAMEQIRALRDSTTGEQILNGSLANNTYLWLMHPANVTKYTQTHPTNGTFDQQGITYANQVNALAGNHMMKGSYNIDTANNIAEDGTNYVGCLVNPKANFKVGYQVPYTIGPWEERWEGGQKFFIKRAFMKVTCMPKVFYISGAYKKAFHVHTYVYMNDGE